MTVSAKLVDHLRAALGAPDATEQVPGSDPPRWELIFRVTVGERQARVELHVDESAGGDVHLFLIDAVPAKTGAGTRAMDALRAYCEPRGIALTLNSLTGSASFFAHFAWLAPVAEGSTEFHSTWPVHLGP